MPQPALLPFRQQAAEHVVAAKRLLEGTGQELIYACLELRLAIEALAYDTLQNYMDDASELVDAAHQDWQPSKVLEKLKTYDPLAGTALRMEVRITVPGREPEVIVGTDDRMSAAWAERAHRSMGSFLHQRTITQVKRGKKIDEAVLRDEAARILERLDQILASEVPDMRVATRFGYPCPDCGADISVSALALMTGPAKTKCGNCQVEWNVEPSGKGPPRFSRRR